MKNEKFTIITGACGGLGRAFCNLEAQACNNLFLTGTDTNRLQVLKAELTQQYSNIKIETCVCDLSKQEDIASVFEVLKSKKIACNKLINNAGYIAEGALLDFSEDTMLKVIKVNCEGVTLFTYKFIKEFEKDLKILTVSSLGAFYPMPYMGLYSATKSYLLNVMLALREEVKHLNIDISVLCPGGIYTNIEMKEAIKSQGVSGKLSSMEPDAVAKYALKKLDKNKPVIVPGAFNRFLKAMSKPFSPSFLAKVVGGKWQKANSKRKEKKDE